MIVAQVFLEAMEGCHLLLGPLFVMQTAIFRVCPSAVVQIFAAVSFKESRSLVPSAIVGRLSCFVSSASLDCFRPVLAVALNRCSFSSASQPKFFFLAAFGSTFFAASSRIAHKRRSLSCPVSLARLRAACFRLVPRRFSLCSVVSRARLEALLSRIIFKRFSRSSLDSWDSLAKTRLRSAFMNSLEKTDDSSRHLCAMSQQHFGALFTMLADKPT